MKKKLFNFILIVYSINAFTEISFIKPLPYSIHRNNYIEFQIKSDSLVTFDSVIFVLYSNYYYLDYYTRKKADKSYSYILDRSNIPDCYLNVYAELWENNQVKYIGKNLCDEGFSICLDKNTKIKETILVSLELKNRKELFSNPLNETFSNVKFNSCWDKEFLYFNFFVKDKYLNRNFADTTKKILCEKDFVYKMLWLSDGIELNFDINNNKNEYKELDDFELSVNISGEYHLFNYDLSKKLFFLKDKDLKISINTYGTINNNIDIDSGYSIFIALPFKELGIIPGVGDTIGFDIQNYNVDVYNGKSFRVIWSGSEHPTNDNVSEWATLVFHSDKKSYTEKIIIVAFIIFLLIIIIVVLKKKIFY